MDGQFFYPRADPCPISTMRENNRFLFCHSPFWVEERRKRRTMMRFLRTRGGLKWVSSARHHRDQAAGLLVSLIKRKRVYDFFFPVQSFKKRHSPLESALKVTIFSPILQSITRGKMVFVPRHFCSRCCRSAGELV